MKKPDAASCAYQGEAPASPETLPREVAALPDIYIAGSLARVEAVRAGFGHFVPRLVGLDWSRTE